MLDFPAIFDLPNDDTIVAIATPPGRSALGILRISGPRAIEITDMIWRGEQKVADLPAAVSRVGALRLLNGIVDKAVITLWRSPKSYTGQDLVEFTLHGNPSLLASAEREIIRHGARIAGPGEFTYRAVLNGKLDLSEAGAISALIEAPNIAAARAASRTLGGEFSNRCWGIIESLIDLETGLTAETEFPEYVESSGFEAIIERIREVKAKIESLYKESLMGHAAGETNVVVIAGPTNVGKSTLANALLGRSRSIVHHEPGTTRDLIEAECSFGQISATLVDTAGLRDTGDGIEVIGVNLAHNRLAEADLVLLVLDGSREQAEEDRIALQKSSEVNRIIVLNKKDIGIESSHKGDIEISASLGDGIEELREMVSQNLLREGTEMLWAGSWQIERLGVALEAVNNALEGAEKNAFDASCDELVEGSKNLKMALGENISEDILARVFENFCIGK